MGLTFRAAVVKAYRTEPGREMMEAQFQRGGDAPENDQLSWNHFGVSDPQNIATDFQIDIAECSRAAGLASVFCRRSEGWTSIPE